MSPFDFLNSINDTKKNEVSVYAAGKNVTVNFNNEKIDNARLMVYNLLGQPVYASSITSQTEVASLDEMPNGYYLVSVKNAGAVSTKRVFLSK